MKRAFIYTIFLLTAGVFFTELKAQEVYLGEVKIIQNRFEQRGDSVYIEMNMNLNGLPVHKNQSFILTPVVETEKASEELPSIVINGKRREKAYQRSLAFNHGRPPFPIYTTVIVNQWSRERIAYNVVIPYETWMKDAKLNLRENFCECGGEKRLISIKMLAQTIKLENQEDTIVEMVSIKKEEDEKNTYYKEGSAYLDFPLNQTHILPDFRGNQKELDKIRGILDSITSNPDYEITGIYLTGYASPEGSYAQNEVLSKDRTRALRDYLRCRYSFPANLYHVDWRGEDWIGLKRLILLYGMPNEEQVLSIMDNYNVFEGREKRLMDLNNGKPYRYMMKHFFPELRRVDYKITYKIIK